MTRVKLWLALMIALGCLLAVPSRGFAQSSIGGTVKDTEGGVLPGVTVEVTSPALIEGTKSATTDGSGAYRITDLRPGMYTVKFSLTGFSTVERSAFQLLTDFNARIDAEMKVGALEETVTVTGAAPIVDVQSAVKVAVLDREALDNIPNGHSIFSLGQLILGVALSAPDVGGSAGAMSTYMSMRAGSVSAANNTVMVDGMVINGLMLDGAVQTYINDADFQEMSYQTAGAGADRSGGGVSLNMVPKEGGNRLSGDGLIAVRPGSLQGNNYTDRIKAWGLPIDKKGSPAISSIDHIYDFAGSGGGPIKKDKLWFFLSGRMQEPVNKVPNTFYNDGNQGLDDNYIRQTLVRLTYQLSPRHKIGAYYERVYKHRFHDMSAFTDPETASTVWTSPDYSTKSAKYTGTLSSKLLVEAGYSANSEFYWNLAQPGIQNDRQPADHYYNQAAVSANPSFYSGQNFYTRNISLSGTGGYATGSRVASFRNFPISQVVQGSVSYVTGAHHAKAGATWKFGKYGHGGDSNGDLAQVYGIGIADANLTGYETVIPTYKVFTQGYTPTNGPNAGVAVPFVSLFPSLVTIANGGTATSATNVGYPCNRGTANGTNTGCTVTIRNNPYLSQETLNYDAGLFVQDSFTMKRMTINAGLRYEMVNVTVDDLYRNQCDATKPNYYCTAGRFVPAREMSGDLTNIPNWKDWAPRFQVVYDVFGNSRTAVKYSFNRYNEGVTVGLAQGFNPMFSTTSSRNWVDLNNDDIAQGSRTWDATGTTYTDCVYGTAGCEIYLSGAAANGAPIGTQQALEANFGLPSSQDVYGGADGSTKFPRQYRLEQGFEIQHALLPRLSLSATYYHGWNKNRTKTVSTARIDDGTTGAQYAQMTMYNPIDGTPYTYYRYTPATALPTAANRAYLEPLTDSQYDAYSTDFQMRPFPGAQLGGGISIERTMTNSCRTSLRRTAAEQAAYPQTTAGVDPSAVFVDPNSLRFCDDAHLGAYPGAPAGLVYEKPYNKSFKLSGAFPIVYGINFGVSYQNLDGGGINPTFRYGTAFTYPTGTATTAGAGTMLGKDAVTGALGAVITACPTAYGCVPGAVNASANPTGSALGTALTLFPTGYIKAERITQLDLRFSKTFRYRRYTFQPNVEIFNAQNIDQVRGRSSSELAVSTGTYLQPNTMLQGRIIGLGANIKW